MARRSRDQSRAGRDIAPLPPIADPVRRSRCHYSLRLFCETYFPKKFKKKWGKHHLVVIREFEKVLRGTGEYRKVALAMPRGTGKSTLSFTAAIWAILYAHCRFVVLIGFNKDEATKLLGAVKTALTKNKTLIADFPEALYPLKLLGGSARRASGQLYLGEPTDIGWNSKEIILPTIPGSRMSGSRAVCVGIFGGIRGKSGETGDGETIRPDVAIIDDPQSDKSARSKTMTDGIREAIDKTIEGLAEDGETLAMIMPCTVIREGDAADQYLSPDEYKEWKKLRYKMVEKFPDNMELWRQYGILRRESPTAANEFYRANRETMDVGAILSWPESYNARHVDSALQHAMNLWSDNLAAFMSERQNEPIRPDVSQIIVPEKEIVKRLNGLDQATVPLEATTLTGMIDCHDDLLYWTVCAWTPDFTGFVVDYGTFPDQGRVSFVRSDKTLRTLKTLYQGSRSDAAILMGVETLCRDLLGREWDQEDESGGVLQIGRLLVDAGYKPKSVEGAIRNIGQSAVAKPSLGQGIKAAQRPYSEYREQPGQKIGYHWIDRKPQNRVYRHLFIDVNFWKGQVHDALHLKPGDRGGLTFWGHDRKRHRMIAEHLNGETATLVKANGREVNEWALCPNAENHLFDCLVGCMAAASSLGIATPENAPLKKSRRF